MANIKLNHIFKVYPNGVKAVNDFCLDITNEEFVVFVGPSGCGKSTTLRMIAGLEEITAGELYIGDTYCNELEPKDRDIAMVFQNYALYPHMTVYDNMAFGLVNRKMDKEEIRQRVTNAANILGLTDYLDRKPKEMSGGQCQRVALGRAIVRNPKVFLLDEPLSNLDAKLRATMRTEIAKLHQKLQTTFIYVTHDQVEAMTMGDRIVVMRDGFVQQIDTPKNLYKYPCNKFVAGFIGTPQMNFFNAKINKEDDKFVLKFTDANIDVSFDVKYLMSLDPVYQAGDKDVIFGIRSEHVSISKSDDSIGVKCRVTQLEELGTETLVYGDINIAEENSQVVDSEALKTKVVFKASAEFSANIGEIIEIYFDFTKIHLFDGANEKTINPLLPDHSRVKARISEGIVSISESLIPFPYSKDNFEEGDYELYIPTEAISLGKQINGIVIKIAELGNKKFLYISINKDIFYVNVPTDDEHNIGDSVTIDIDITKADFYQNNEIKYSLIDKDNIVNGKLRMVKMKNDNKEKIKSLYYDLLSSSFAIDNKQAYRTFIEIDDKQVFKKNYSFSFKPENVHVTNEGIEANVVSILDYGNATFAKCQIQEQEIIVKLENGINANSTVYLSFDANDFNVYDASNGVKLL